MDFSGQTRRPFSASDAQVYLDPDPAGSVAVTNEPKLWIVISRSDRSPNARGADAGGVYRRRAGDGRSIAWRRRGGVAHARANTSRGSIRAVMACVCDVCKRLRMIVSTA